MSTREEMLEKAKERGYEIMISRSDQKWYSLIHTDYNLNLELYIETEEFVLNHRKGIVLITTEKCGSFMDDKHFKRIQREIRIVLVDVLWEE